MQYGAGAITYNQKGQTVPPFPSNAAANGLFVESGSGQIWMGGTFLGDTTIGMSQHQLRFSNNATGEALLFIDGGNFQKVAALGDYLNEINGNTIAVNFGQGPIVKVANRIKQQWRSGPTVASDQILIGDVEFVGRGGQLGIVDGSMIFGIATQGFLRIDDNNGADPVQVAFGNLGGTPGAVRASLDTAVGGPGFVLANCHLQLTANFVRTAQGQPVMRNTITGNLETLPGFSGSIVIPAVGTITVLDGIITNFV